MRASAHMLGVVAIALASTAPDANAVTETESTRVSRRLRGLSQAAIARLGC